MTDRTVLITGATAGIGEAAARAFAAAGWRVIGTGRRAERLEALATEIGPKMHMLAFDMRDEAAIDGALASLPPEFQAIDLLMSQLRKTKTNYEFLVQVSKTAPGAMDDVD